MDEILFNEWMKSHMGVWKDWKKKRFALNRKVRYEDECCWNTLTKNVKPELVDYKIGKIKKGLKDFKIDEKTAIN
jgi:hypothetical protein